MTTTPSDPQTSNAADKLRDEYYEQCEAIIKKAKYADRLLLFTETKTLRELAKSIRDLNEAITPCGEDKLIIIKPKRDLPPEEFYNK